MKAPGPNHWTTREFLEEAASREMQTVMENDQVESSGAPQHWEVWETEMTQDDEKGSGKEWLEREKEN